MKKFAVRIPIAGYVYKEVEANSKEEAIETAMDDGYCYDELEEMEMLNRITKGNVCYAPQHEAEAEEI